MFSEGRRSVQELEDAFIKVTFEDENPAQVPQSVQGQDPAYGPWFDQASAKFTDPAGFGATTLKKLYPKHSVTLVGNVNLLGFPAAYIQPVSPPELITTLYFIPLARRMGEMSGMLIDSVKYGSFRIGWDKYDFLLYIVRYPQGFGEVSQQFLVHEGSEDASRSLLMSAGSWENELHEEIYVFNQGFWQKDHALWLEVQKAKWSEVILKDAFKTALTKDVYGFFESEELYKSLSIPWKRGLIMYGPPGNGKTISMKAIMKDCDAKGYTPLYVKSFQSWMGEEASMAAVFNKARQMSPCVVVLEDLDSLINDRNRSFFLNELDGFEGNDGLLVIGSTNHFDRLDPALSGRPSRFDRKYSFDDPDQEERELYSKFWQNKLKRNDSIDFPDTLVSEVAVSTEKFSFAYLKEAFVSTLVLLAGVEDDKPTFATILRSQIKSLRDQLDKDPEHRIRHRVYPGSLLPPPSVTSSMRSDVSMRSPYHHSNNQARVYDVGVRSEPTMTMPGELPGLGNQRAEGRRDLRSMALTAASLGRSFIY